MPNPDLSEAACQARLKFNALHKLVEDSAGRIQEVLDEVLPDLHKAGVDVSFLFNENPPPDSLGEQQPPRYELKLTHPELRNEHYFYKDEG